MKTIAFFNNKGGVGKTSLVYHLAWMYAEMGLRVVAADLDPQSNLSAMLVREERLEELWETENGSRTIYGAMGPLLEGVGDLGPVHVEPVGDADLAGSLGLLVGDLGLSLAESELNTQWDKCLTDDSRRAFRVISLPWRAIESAAQQMDAAVVLIDVGPNLGAINRAALLAAEQVVIPLAPDLYSLQGLRNLGPTLRRWRVDWRDRVLRRQRAGRPVDISLPAGQFAPAGYIVMQHAERMRYPVRASQRWIEQIPTVYREKILDEDSSEAPDVRSDAECLALLKQYRSLMPLAQQARKPMFKLNAADGALGGHATAVRNCYADFERLARRVAQKCGVVIDP